MLGGQAGAPADDDHVPWSRPPRLGHRDHRDWQITTRAALGWADPQPGAGPGGGARARPERPMGGAGAKRKKTAEGLRN